MPFFVCAQRNIYYNQKPQMNTPMPKAANTLYRPDTMDTVSKVQSPCKLRPTKLFVRCISVRLPEWLVAMWLRWRSDLCQLVGARSGARY